MISRQAKANAMKNFRNILSGRRAFKCLLGGVLFLPFAAWVSHSIWIGEFWEHLYLGQEFENRAIEPMKGIGVPARTPYGYDGQFYSQLALDPLLLREDLSRALDIRSRASRILLPAVCWVAGVGKTKWILSVYIFSNYVFVVILVVLLLKIGIAEDGRGIALLIAIMWSSGVIVSTERALLDLPAVTLLLLACLASQGSGVVWFSLAMLTREASLTSAGCLIRNEDRFDFRTAIKLFGLITAGIFPWVMWMLYIRWRLGAMEMGGGAVSVEVFTSYLQAWGAKWEGLKELPIRWGLFYFSNWERSVWEILALSSISFQAGWIAIRWKLRSPFWWMALGNLLYIPIMGSDGFSEQEGFCRILLPLTVGFNLVLSENRGKWFWVWFVLGNVGMFGLLRKMLTTLI